jgi:hypothetical protein
MAYVGAELMNTQGDGELPLSEIAVVEKVFGANLRMILSVCSCAQYCVVTAQILARGLVSNSGRSA